MSDIQERTVIGSEPAFDGQNDQMRIIPDLELKGEKHYLAMNGDNLRYDYRDGPVEIRGEINMRNFFNGLKKLFSGKLEEKVV